MELGNEIVFIALISSAQHVQTHFRQCNAEQLRLVDMQQTCSLRSLASYQRWRASGQAYRTPGPGSVSGILLDRLGAAKTESAANRCAWVGEKRPYNLCSGSRNGVYRNCDAIGHLGHLTATAAARGGYWACQSLFHRLEVDMRCRHPAFKTKVTVPVFTCMSGTLLYAGVGNEHSTDAVASGCIATRNVTGVTCFLTPTLQVAVYGDLMPSARSAPEPQRLTLPLAPAGANMERHGACSKRVLSHRVCAVCAVGGTVCRQPAVCRTICLVNIQQSCRYSSLRPTEPLACRATCGCMLL